MLTLSESWVIESALVDWATVAARILSAQSYTRDTFNEWQLCA